MKPDNHKPCSMQKIRQKRRNRARFHLENNKISKPVLVNPDDEKNYNNTHTQKPKPD